MQVYLLTQNHNNNWDTFNGCVVRAENEEEARNTHPSGGKWEYSDWVRSPESVKVEWIGEDHSPTAKSGVILASYISG